MMDPVTAAIAGLLITPSVLCPGEIQAAYAQMLADGTSCVPLLSKEKCVSPEEWRDCELEKR